MESTPPESWSEKEFDEWLQSSEAIKQQRIVSGTASPDELGFGKNLIGPIQNLLPILTDESLRKIEISNSNWTQIYLVNLLDYTCSAPLCIQMHQHVPPNDFGRLCKHIIKALRYCKLVEYLPPMAKGMANHGYPNAYGIIPGCFAADIYGKPIYITGIYKNSWINVYALKRKNGVNYFRFGYSLQLRTWFDTSPTRKSYWNHPPVDIAVIRRTIRLSDM